MAAEQATLHDFHDERAFETVPFAKTIIFRLRPLTNRKRERVEHALSEAARVSRVAAERMPSVPKVRWGTAKPASSTWYSWAKTMDHDLSNKTAHENIQRVREAFRSWQSSGYDGKRPVFEKDDRCSFYYEQPRYRTYEGTDYLSLPLAAGRGERELLPIIVGEYEREYLEALQADDGDYDPGRGELVRRDDGYQFHQTVRTTVEVLSEPETVVGVDVGLTNLAVAGAVQDGEKRGAELWSGTEAAEMRERFYHRKRAAQSEGEVDDIRDEESRYIEHVCHVVSREVVEWSLDKYRPKIVLEDLTDIRQTFIRREREHNADERRALHSWAFQQLQKMIEYKATEAGIPVEYLPGDEVRYTSQECNECGHTADENRDGVYFECVECGYEVNADVNGAFNIALRLQQE